MNFNPLAVEREGVVALPVDLQAVGEEGAGGL